MTDSFRLRIHALLALSLLVLGSLSAATVEGQTPIKSEPYIWKNVTVGGGGFIPGIVFSPVERGLVYLRSDMGGCYRWDEPLKRWTPLNDTMAESSYHGGESIAPDPVDPNVVYVAAGMYRSDPAAMLRSSDRGRTWEVYPVPFKMGGNEDGRGMGERLAVDPNDTHVLLFGSRHDGLMQSTDNARTWKQVDRFPLKGGGQGGLSVVVFDPTSGSPGNASRTIFVGSADPGQEHLFVSKDAGGTWSAIPGGPGQDLLPIQAKLDPTGILYITYANGIGPNGVTAGGVFALNTRTGQWNDITPEKGPERSRGGYGGLSLDHQHPGTLAVSTFNHWSPTDTVWRTTDGGQSWKDIAGLSQRDVTATPFLYWGKSTPRLGWWIAALAIDPFDSDHAVYATGATVYATNDFSKVSQGLPTHWTTWVQGIEQTAILTVVSPTGGPHLLSGFGDIGGFAHDDIDRSPPLGMYDHPMFTDTDCIDYAGEQPSVVVRAGRGGNDRFALSEDSGHTWQPLVVPTQPQRRRSREGSTWITVTADGKNILILSPQPVISSDQGSKWTQVKGLPNGARPVPDRVDPQTVYALDTQRRQMLLSRNGGQSFSPEESVGLPESGESRPRSWTLQATTEKKADLWIIADGNLFHSTDAGQRFAKVDGGLQVEMLSFGMPPAGRDYPALFAVGKRQDIKAIWRSDDCGESWLRVNDDDHQYGTRFRCISGDPRIFGRVYVGTDGRGILYGDLTQWRH